MRVLYLSNGYGPHDHRFLEAISRLGAEALFLPRLGRNVAETRPLPPRVRRLEAFARRSATRTGLGLRFSSHLRRVLREHPVDVVHAGPVQDCAWPAARAGATSLVTMSWGSDLLLRGRFGLGRWLARAALRRSQGFLGDCEAVRDRAVDLGVERERTVIFPWGVDLERFRPSAASAVRRQLGWEGATVAICLRAWEPDYGVEAVLQAFRAAARRDPSLCLILGGDGSLRRRILRRVRGDGLETRVWLPGYIEYADLPQFYQAADVYLAASRSDGSSVSLLEAMACGLPALVSDIPGNREWVDPGRSGHLFRYGDWRRLAELLASASSNRVGLRDMGRQGRQIVEHRANWEQNFPRLMQAYRMAVEASS